MASNAKRKKILRIVDSNIYGKLEKLQDDILSITEHYKEGSEDAIHLATKWMMIHQAIGELKIACKHIRKQM